MKLYYVLLGVLLLLYSCSSDDDYREVLEEGDHYDYTDAFDEIGRFWSKNEVTDTTRYEITDDPVDLSNSTLKFYLYPEDFNAGGKRNEFKLHDEDNEEGRLTYHAFKFLFTEEFFSKRTEKDRVIIHQWHDKPPKGVSWSDYAMGTHPPVHIFIQINPNHEHYIVYSYGLWNKEVKNNKSLQYEEKLEPNKWYTFENLIKWSRDSTGYSVPKVNKKKLVPQDRDEEGKLYGANMYNKRRNYFKMGLYGYKNHQDTISVYFDDFYYVNKETSAP